MGSAVPGDRNVSPYLVAEVYPQVFADELDIPSCCPTKENGYF